MPAQDGLLRDASSTVQPIYYDPFDYAIDRDPYPVWERMREEQPLYCNERYQFWAFSRFDDVLHAYRETATFSSTHGVMLETLDRPVDLSSLISMDPPEHDSMRKLVSRAFTPRRVSDLEQSIVALVDDYLDPFLGAPGFDYVTDFGALLPPMVIGELLGVPRTDRDMLRLWFDEMMHREDGTGDPTDAAVAAGTAMFEYTSTMLAERRKRPEPDMVTALIEVELEEEGRLRKLTDFEVVNFVALLAGAGVETVARLLSWAAVTLARFPDERARLVEDADLLPNAVEELLRYEAPSPVNGRWVLRPYQAYGVEIPAESKVLLLNGSANRDPREFEEPDRFDVGRTITRHITFGSGAHFCLGAALARLEARVALAGTLARFPRWEIDEAELVPVHTTTVRGFKAVPIHVG
jgi:cytochrome P450